jgi:hypothetical protein
MGTSNAYGGPGGGTPLVPSWLGPGNGGAGDPDSARLPSPSPLAPPAPAPLPPIPPAAEADRFRAARSNFSRFARSGGNDRASLGRAVSNYVSRSSGGSRAAAQRMGASRAAGGRLLSFLSDVADSGPRDALRALNLENLAGRPIEEVFLGLVDYVCPEGGTIDEGIARAAFIEAITELAENGITNFDGITADQMQTVFELYAAHAIEARLCNDIGTKAITLPADLSAAARVQVQLLDFVRRGVSDALTSARAAMLSLTQDRILDFVTDVYEQAFFVLQTMGDAEAT